MGSRNRSRAESCAGCLGPGSGEREIGKIQLSLQEIGKIFCVCILGFFLCVELFEILQLDTKSCFRMEQLQEPLP